MYRIIGGDGREYGPVTSDQVREWIREGRANAETRASGPDDEWRPLSSFAEFAELFGPPSAPVVSPSHMSPIAPGVPVDPMAGPRTFVELGPPADASSAVPTPSKRPPNVTNWLVPAIFCTLCCCLPTGIPAIVFAAHANSRKSAGDWDGAQAAARSARTWFWVSVGLAFVIWSGTFLAILSFRGR